MKNIQISDELFDRLKKFLVDPFDDTPDTIVTRLVEIAEKAQNRWSAWDEAGSCVPPASVRPKPSRAPASVNVNEQEVEQPVVL